jgi:nitrate reductase NapAB chaperone NapD
MNKTYQIAGILVKNPEGEYLELQKILTAYGCVIRSRLGINNDNFDGGIIILDLKGDEQQIELLIQKLNNLPGVEVQYMDFI